MIFAAPAFAFDSTALDARLCADKSEDSSTEAGGICITCLMSGVLPYSTTSASSDEKDLPVPTDPAEVRRDLAFMEFLSGHSNWTGMDKMVFTKNGLKAQIQKLNKEIEVYDQKVAEYTQVVEEMKSTLAIANSEILNEEKYHEFLKAQEKYQQTEIAILEKKIANLKSEGAAQWLIQNNSHQLAWWKSKNNKTQARASEPFDKSDFYFLKATLEQELSSQQFTLEGTLHQKSLSETLLSNYEGQLYKLNSVSTPQQEMLIYETEYKKYLASVLNRPRAKTCGMSPAELMAIQIYTGNGYREINTALRAGGNSAKEVQPFVDELNSALKKLRNYSGQVIRLASLPAAALGEYQPGNIITYQAFTSSSVTGDWHGNIKFYIQSKTGHYIDPLSQSMGEDEVLFASGAKFKVLSREIGEAYRGKIVLEEVTP